MNRRNFTKTISMSTALLSMESSTIFKKKTIIPTSLKAGDTIAFITPGSAVKEEKFVNAFNNAKNLGLEVVHTPNIYKKYGFLAGTDQERLSDIHTHFANPKVKAIWCLRGGYGCTRIIDKINYDLIKKNPKLIIGYSDVTALLNAIYKKTGLLGIHGVVASSSVLSDYTFQHTKALLLGEKKQFDFPFVPQSDAVYDSYTITEGQAKGKIVGGNLCLLASMIGTDYAPSYKNKIVIIEEVGEKPYRVDRMLTQLIHGSDLKQACAIIFGVFNDCEAKPDEGSFTLKETIISNIKPLNIPSIYGFPFGHVTDITPLPIGIEASFNTENQTLSFKIDS
jgi:muramoyltetrapeptide carboxypeptidase